MKKIIILCLTINVLFAFNSFGKENETRKLLIGKIIDAESGTAIAGATVRLIESNKGTYANRLGQFRLSVPFGKQILRISSLGYETQKINLIDRTDSLTIKMRPSSILLKSVDVTANITADQVVSRAIAKKQDNMQKIKTFSGLLYSKLTMELGGSLIQGSSDNPGEISIGVPFSGGDKSSESADSYKFFVLESFARNSIDFPKKINHSQIIQRRQTANIAPENNLLTIGNYQSFYEERINIVNANFATPLAKDAMDFYKFEIIDKTMIDNRFVYVISVTPKTTTYPAFVGTIKVIEGTYNLIEVNLSPSSQSAVSFIDDLNYVQKFEEIKSEIWYPTYLDVTAKAKIDVLKGFADIKADLRAVSIYSEMSVNEPLADSLYNAGLSRISVSNLADSVDNTFWEQNALREISEKEIKMYKSVSEGIKKRDSLQTQDSNFKFDWASFYFDFNRVGAVSLGWAPELTIYNFHIDSKYYYSFGQKNSFGELGAFYTFDLIDKVDLTLRVNSFSIINEAGNNQSYSRFYNSILSLLEHDDYYNYFKSDGFLAGWEINYKSFSLWSEFESSRQSSLKITTKNTLFYTNKDWRKNPAIEEGNFKTISVGTSVGTADNLNLTGRFDYLLDFTAMYGENFTNQKTFRSVEGRTKLSIPTFNTGYLPMMIDWTVNAGIASDNLPSQYQFLLNSTMLFLAAPNTFASAPTAKYGGTQYVATHFNFNSRDLWWRALGLPMFKGRGLELLVGGSVAKFNNYSNSIFLPTGKNIYAEAGFGLGKIPLFFTNILFLESNFRWGLAPLGKKRFGWELNISSPF